MLQRCPVLLFFFELTKVITLSIIHKNTLCASLMCLLFFLLHLNDLKADFTYSVSILNSRFVYILVSQLTGFLFTVFMPSSILPWQNETTGQMCNESSLCHPQAHSHETYYSLRGQYRINAKTTARNIEDVLHLQFFVFISFCSCYSKHMRGYVSKVTEILISKTPMNNSVTGM